MTIRVSSLLEGSIQPKVLEVELNSHVHIPSLTFVGLAGTEIQEAKVRIHSAFLASELDFPRKKIVVNFAPADLKKLGTHLDLAIATAILLSEMRQTESLPHYFAAGELSLSGHIRSNRKLTRALCSAISGGADTFICAAEDIHKVRRIYRKYFSSQSKLQNQPTQKPLTFLPVSDLNDLRDALLTPFDKNRDSKFNPENEEKSENALDNHDPERGLTDLADIFIPAGVHRMLCLAIGGHHHLLISGPKGQGKSFTLGCVEMIGKTLVDEIPLDSVLIQELEKEAEELSFPVRQVGSHVRPATLLGKATSDSVFPGEFSKAHRGILLADEFLEWPRDAIESFREPLESGTLHLSRAGKTVELPAAFLLIASANECPCGGYQGEPDEPYGEPCVCNSKEQIRYRARLSGPVRDRMTLHLKWGGQDPRTGKTVSLLETAEKIKKMRKQQRSSRGKLHGQLTSLELRDLEAQTPEIQTFQRKFTFTNYRKKAQTTRLALTLGSFYGKENADFTDFQEADTLLKQSD
jgi:magnesium chelatase family protein